jgi:hypothetical protein
VALKKFLQVDGERLLNTKHGAVKQGPSSINSEFLIHVKYVSGTKEKITAVVTYESKELKFSNQFEIPVSTLDGSSNFIKQAYEHLKTLPEFEGAADI